MESLETFVADDVEEVRGIVAGYLASLIPTDKTGVVSVCMVCSVLAQSAGFIWEKVYRDAKGRGVPNKDIERLVHAISAFLNSWHKPQTYINCNDDPTIDSKIVNLQSRLVAWLPVAKAWQVDSSVGQT